MKGGDPMENKEYEYDRYEVKLSRLMNIGKDGGFCLRMFASYALFAVYGIFVHGAETESIAFLAGVFLLIVLLKLCSNPGRLEITRTTVQFSRLRIQLGRHTRIYMPKTKETFTVCNIKRMEYLQTSFEKMFSCGHICIRGDVYLEFGKKEERTFTIYGVKHFDDISAWMKDFMILSSEAQV
jgi:hypothetical protein